MVQRMMIVLAALTTGAIGCSTSWHTNTDLTEYWRTTVESDVYPRASRELDCPRESLDFTCLNEECRWVEVRGCGRMGGYRYGDNGMWTKD
jgi:hypothetical protein